MITTSITRSFHIFMLWQSGWQKLFQKLCPWFPFLDFFSVNFFIKFSLSSHVSAPSVFSVNSTNRRLFNMDLSLNLKVFSYSCWCFCSMTLISSSIGLLDFYTSKSLFASLNHLFRKSPPAFKFLSSCLGTVFSWLILSILISNLCMILVKNLIKIFSWISTVSFIQVDGKLSILNNLKNYELQKLKIFEQFYGARQFTGIFHSILINKKIY